MQRHHLVVGQGDRAPGIIGDALPQRHVAAAQKRMRLLIAYGREFVEPRPYKLDDLARASGMSISGVRTVYDDEEIAQAARLTGAKLHRRPSWPPESEGAS